MRCTQERRSAWRAPERSAVPQRYYARQQSSVVFGRRRASLCVGRECTPGHAIDCSDRQIVGWIASDRPLGGGDLQELMAKCVQSRCQSTRTEKPIAWIATSRRGLILDEDAYGFGEKCGFIVSPTNADAPEVREIVADFLSNFERVWVQPRTARHALARLPRWFEDYNKMRIRASRRGEGPRAPLVEVERAAATNFSETSVVALRLAGRGAERLVLGCGERLALMLRRRFPSLVGDRISSFGDAS